MARAELNPVFLKIRGALGDVVLKKYGTKIVVTRKPRFKNRKFTVAQRNNQKRFKRASVRAKALLADMQVRRRYEKLAATSGKPILSLMIRDILKKEG